MRKRTNKRRQRTRIRANARVSIQKLTDSGATVRFEDADGALSLTIAREVFPKLVDMIQFAALSPAPPIPEDAPPPHVYRAVVAPKAPGEGDGA